MKNYIWVLGMILVCVTSFLMLINIIEFGSKQRTFESENVIRNSEKDDPATVYSTYGSHILMMSSEEIKLVTINGDKILWSDKINVSNKIFKVEDGNILLASKEGHQLFLYNEKGKVCVINTGYQIIDASINKNGYISVIQDDDTKNVITIYDSKGKKVMERVTYSEKSGRPTSSDISDDDRYLAVSYIGIDEKGVKSDLEFFDIKSDELRDNIYKVEAYKDELIYTVNYNKDGDLVVVSDKELKSLNIVKNSNKKVILKNKIDRLIFDKQQNKIITLQGQSTEKGLEMQNKVLCIYDWNSLGVAKAELSEDVSLFKVQDENILVGQEKSMCCYNINAGLKWKVSMPQGFNDVILVDSNRVLVVGGSQKTIYRLK